MLKLQFRDQPGRFIKLTAATLTLGRDESNDLVINDPSVSDFHAEISCDANDPIIVDLLSASGTFVNEHRIKGRCQLKAWDTIRLGTAQLQVTEPNTHRPEDWALRAESDLLATQFHSLGESTVIGRDAACDITIDSKLLSRRHARIIIEGAVLKILDLGSANGTYLNDSRIEEASAGPGDVLSFDQHRFVIVGPVTGAASDEETATDRTVIRRPDEDATVIAPMEPEQAPPTVIVDPISSSDTALVAGEETLLYVAPPPAALLSEIGTIETPRLISLELARQQLGRSQDCEFLLEDQSISKRHAELYFDEDHWHIRDLGASNGVLVNFEKVDQQALRDGDRIKLGRLEFEFTQGEHTGPAEEAATKIYQPAQTPKQTARSGKYAIKSGKASGYRWLAGLALLLGAVLLWLV